MAALYFISASGPKAYPHYQATIETPIQYDKVERHLSQTEMETLDNILAGQPIFAWGAKSGERNIRNWENLSRGDYIIIYVQGAFTRLARIAMKTRKSALAEELWGIENNETWEYMYFLKDMQVIDYQLTNFNQDLGYNFPAIYGFGEVSQERYVDRFGSLETYLRSRLLLTKLTPEQFEEKIEKDLTSEQEDSAEELSSDDTESQTELMTSLTVSECQAQIDKLDGRLRHRVPQVAQRAIRTIERNGSLARLIKEQRGYACQLCSTVIPKVSGGYYAEAHHLEAISDGGLDFSKNIIVVCPNCHKRCHYGDVKKQAHNAEHVVLTIYEKVFDVPITSIRGTWLATVTKKVIHI